MTKATNAKQVLKAIGCEHLQFVKGDGYWYFIFDDTKRGLFDTHSEMVMYMSHMTLEQWVEIGQAFAAKMEKNRHNQ